MANLRSNSAVANGDVPYWSRSTLFLGWTQFDDDSGFQAITKDKPARKRKPPTELGIREEVQGRAPSPGYLWYHSAVAPGNSMNLRDRFETFVKTMPGFESVDLLLDAGSHAGKERADYLVWHRAVIVEQKTLVVDPADKPQQFVNRLVAQRRIRPFRKSTTRAVFDSLPDGKALEHKMYLNMTRSLEKDIAKADRQTQTTREIFNIPEAVGILMILNEAATALPPDLIRYRLDLVYGDTSRGAPRCPHNDGVIVISDVHALMRSGIGMPCFSFPTIHSKSPEGFRAFADALIEAWSAFNHLPVMRYTTEEMRRCVVRPSVPPRSSL